MFIWEKMDDPYIYGPLTAEQIDAILVPHHMVPEPDGFYIGTTIPQPQWDFCKIIIPVENSNEVNANNIGENA